MRIYGIGYENVSSGCYEYHLLQELQGHMRSMHIQNQMPKDADVIIVNMDIDNSYRFFGKGAITPSNAYVVMIVHELDRSLLPMLKLADLLVFTSEAQQRVCEELIGVKYPSMVLSLPTGDFSPCEDTHGDCMIYVDNNFANQSVTNLVKKARKAFEKQDSDNIEYFHLLIPGPSKSYKSWHRLDTLLREISPKFNLHNTNRMLRSEYLDLLEKCIKAEYISKSMPISRYEKEMVARRSGLIHELIRDTPILADFKFAGIETKVKKSLDAWNYYKNEVVTFVEFGRTLTKKIKESHKQKVQERLSSFDEVQIDKLEDLNIVYGQPLSNRYVFSICFRNQEEKIKRCLKSIVSQNLKLDFGVVLVDDQSSDNSTQVIVEFLKEYPQIDACVVYNKVNRRAARNFYNVGHLLTTNDESVICEVDGDDFLAHNQVIDILDRYYSEGALKTNGSYEIYPDDQPYMSPEDVKRHHSHLDYSRPWAIDYCNSWLHLRTTKRKILCSVEISYFMDRHRNDWLLDRHDAAIQPRLIELAAGKAVFIPEVLYKYDLSGENHDHDNAQREEEYLKFFFHIDKIWHPLPLCPSI